MASCTSKSARSNVAPLPVRVRRCSAARMPMTAYSAPAMPPIGLPQRTGGESGLPLPVMLIVPASAWMVAS